MNDIWIKIGKFCFYVSWPGLYCYLKLSHRTRVLVTCGQSIIVVKSWLSDGKWGLPGGGRHRREAMVVGALRELREETGVVLAVDSLTHLGEYLYADRGLRFRYDLFVAEAYELLELKVNGVEICQAKWVDSSMLSSKNASPDVLMALKRPSP